MIKPIKFIYYQMFKSNLSDDDKYSLVPLISAIDSLPLITYKDGEIANQLHLN